MTITLRKKVNDVNDEESYEKVNRKTLTRTTAMEEVIMKRNIPLYHNFMPSFIL